MLGQLKKLFHNAKPKVVAPYEAVRTFFLAPKLGPTCLGSVFVLQYAYVLRFDLCVANPRLRERSMITLPLFELQNSIAHGWKAMNLSSNFYPGHSFLSCTLAAQFGANALPRDKAVDKIVSLGIHVLILRIN